jgi:hypothetical protein
VARRPSSSRSILTNVDSWMARPRELTEMVMREPPNVADHKLIQQLFSDDYTPGLFRINERVPTAEFLWDENIRDYREWVMGIVHADLQSLKRYRGDMTALTDEVSESLARSILAALDLPYRGQALSASHTNQQADALIWRIVKLFTCNDPDISLPIQDAFNELGRATVIPILPSFSDLPLDEMWRISIDAGLIGIEIKERFLGTRQTSPGSLRRAIPLKTESGTSAAREVRDELMRRRTEPLGLDFRQEYFAEVLAANAPRSVVWLTDDYIETIFDLKLIEAQVRVKPDLYFTIIPRDGSHRQDASFDDIMKLLAEEKPLSQVAELRESGRLHICPAGPRTSSIDGRMLSGEAATHLINADVVVVKGARSFEMLQGIKKPAYYCLSGNHSFTESITGLDMDLAQGILLRQDPGVLTYADFRTRATRRARTARGREYGLARMTALEYATARRSEDYKAHLERFDYQVDECNAWLLARAGQLGCTFSEVTSGRRSGPAWT